MLSPKKTKYRKQQKGRRRGTAWRGSDLSYGDYGLQSLDGAWLGAREIEAARMAIQRKTQRVGRLFIRVFPDKPLSKKPLETRMGKGKGAPEVWVAVIHPGRMLYELGGVPKELAQDAFRLAAAKLSVRTRFMDRSTMP
jgi:large subunit ribosomal protein L16